MNEQISSGDRFKLWHKWFWIGIVGAISNVIIGLVYGIALLVEKNHRKEGIIICVFAITWFVFVTFFLSGWLVNAGIVPHYQLLKLT